MLIPKPISHRPDPENHRTSRLFFKGQQAADFYMVGSIAWPEDKKPGFVLLSGQHLGHVEKKIWLFDEQEFWSIDNWLKPDGNLKDRKEGGYWYGISHFISDCWSKYGCRTFFYGGQHPDINQRYMIEFYKSKMVPRSIQLVEIPYVTEMGNDIVSEYVRHAKFEASKDTRLFQLMQTPENDENNGKHALKVLFSGFEWVPWVDMSFKVQPKVEFVRDYI